MHFIFLSRVLARIQVEVPYQVTVKVPVNKEEVVAQRERRTINTTKMVPVTRYKEVCEEVVEIKEELVTEWVDVWKRHREQQTKVGRSSLLCLLCICIAFFF